MVSLMVSLGLFIRLATVTGPAAAAIVSSDLGALAIAVVCSFFMVYALLCSSLFAFASVSTTEL